MTHTDEGLLVKVPLRTIWVATHDRDQEIGAKKLEINKILQRTQEYGARGQNTECQSTFLTGERP